MINIKEKRLKLMNKKLYRRFEKIYRYYKEKETKILILSFGGFCLAQGLINRLVHHKSFISSLFNPLIIFGFAMIICMILLTPLTIVKSINHKVGNILLKIFIFICNFVLVSIFVFCIFVIVNKIFHFWF